MAIISIPRKEIEKISRVDEILIEKINLMGTPVENTTQEAIEIEVLPNRPDLLSVQGFLRTFKAYMGKETGLKEYKIRKSEAKIMVDPIVKEIRPFSMAAIVKGVKFTDEKIKDIMQWQEKIHASIGRDRKKVALGYYVLDKIKFPVRYTARNPKEIRFIPLDADREMNGLQILQQHPTGRAYAWQLEGIEKFPVYYDADKKVLSMPQIINSDYSGHITPGVSDILVECSGTNQETLKKVISLAVCDLIDAGGEAYQVEIIYGDKKEKITLESEKIKLSRINTNKLLGLELKENEIKACLEKMGYNYDIKTETAQVPCWRLDVMHEVDLIEDIAIAYGYNNLIPEIPKVSTIGEESQIEKVKSKIAEILIGLDMNEISTYHMIREEDAKIFNLNKEETIGLKDSKTEYKILRPNLLVQSLITLANNTNSEYPQRLFEIGTSFSLDKENKSETGIKEQEKLCIAIANNNSNFTEVKQILDYLTRMLNKEYVIEQISAEKTHFIEGRLGEIRVNNKPIGILGEIHPQTLANLGIKMPIAALEIDIEQLIN